MTKEIKKEQLRSLEWEIMSNIANPWLFPTHEPVQGFLGVGPIMLVGERPSTGHFNGLSARLLYSVLTKYDMADAHLTDVIKTRGKAKQPYPEDLAPHKRIFDREVEIVKPSHIIVFGQKAYDLLQFATAGTGIKLQQVWHFAHTEYGSEKAAIFDDQIKQALLTIDLSARTEK
jgi:uracil-DNA glycosylase